MMVKDLAVTEKDKRKILRARNILRKKSQMTEGAGFKYEISKSHFARPTKD